MSVRKILTMTLVLMLLLSCGCQDTPAEEAEPSMEPVQEAVVGDEEITDAGELDALWRDYLFFGIATVFNTKDYPTVADIGANRIIQYCWDQYIRDIGEETAKETLEAVSEDSRSVYFPMETAMDYMEKYFNSREINLDEMHDAYYDAEKGDFTFTPHARNVSSYYGNNAWGIALDKAVRHKDDSITVQLVEHAYDHQDLVELIYTINLGMREDGSYYFTSGGQEFIDNNLVTLIGDYQEVGPLDERFTQVIGETEEYIVMGSIDTRVAVFLLDRESFEVMEELAMEYPSQAEVDATSVILYYPDRIDIYDKTFILEESYELPDSMTSVVDEERIMGMDLSPDHQEVVYANREGLKLYHPDSASEGMVIETLPAEGEYPDGRPSIRYFYNPRFVAGGRKVIATMSGYDYNSGFILFNLFDGSYQIFDEYPEGTDTSNVFMDNGTLYQIKTEPSYKSEGDDELTREYIFKYLDFYSGETYEYRQQLTSGDMDYVLFQDMLYNGPNEVAFLTFNANHKISHVNSLHWTSGVIDEDILSIEGAQARILGVLKDGSILCGYYRNPAENGLCLIP